MTTKLLHNTPPRETNGSTTGDRLDYQYQRAAETCLTLLEDSETFCILLEWHDDFVREKKTTTQSLYGFNQVKTRTASQGPWKISQVFGLPRSKRDPAHADSIAAKLFEHLHTFNGYCEEVVLVTNCGITQELDDLVSHVQKVATPSLLPKDQAKTFKKICDQWLMSNGPADGKSENDIFKFISILKLKPESARIEKSALDYKSVLSEAILKFSEIDLTTSQAATICSELLDLVREKSTHEISKTNLPSTEEELRKRKGIQVGDLLPLLSLSNDAYIELRKSGTPVIKTLSRLQRICRNSSVSETETVAICQLKTAWDVWYLKNRSNFQDADLSLLRTACATALDSYLNAEKPEFRKLVQDAGEIAALYETKLPVRGLNEQLVVGLIFSIAAERGPAYAAV